MAAELIDAGHPVDASFSVNSINQGVPMILIKAILKRKDEIDTSHSKLAERSPLLLALRYSLKKDG